MTADLTAQLIGVWKLVAYNETRDDGTDVHPLGEHPEGYLIYTADGFVSAQLMKPGRTAFDSEAWGAGSPEEYQEAAAGYIAYCGAFTVDESERTVTHVPDVAFVPNLLRRSQTRAVELHVDRLVLRPIDLVGSRSSRVDWMRASSPG
jgi:Lipocalin-like domain